MATPVTQINWPSSLPTRPLFSDFREGFAHTMFESLIDLGPKTRRRRLSKNIRRFVCTYILDYGQVETLRQFYEETTYGGVLSFNFTHPRSGVPIVVRFGTDSIEIKPISYQKYKVQITFEQMPWQSETLFIPDATANVIGLNSDYYTVINYQGPASYFYEGTHKRIWFIHYANMGGRQTNYLGYYDLDEDSFSDLLDLQIPNTIGTDNHHMTSIIISDDGHILFCYDNITTSHNKGIVIKRSDNPEDRSGFSTVYNGSAAGLWQGYPTMWKRASDGRIYMIWRGNISSVGEYHNCLIYSDDEGLTWSVEKIIVEEVQGVVNDPINYYIISNGSEKWIGLLIIVRNGSGGRMKYAYFIKSNDGITWQNLEGTFSKNIETEGYITSDEVKANCAIDLTLNPSNNDYLSPIGVAFDDDGNCVIIWERLIWNGESYDYDVQMITYFDGVKKQYAISNIWFSRGGVPGGSAIIVYPGKIIDLITKMRDVNGTEYDVLMVLRSYDGGQNWEEIRQVFDYADEMYIGYLRLTGNTFAEDKALVTFTRKLAADNKHDPCQLVLRR